MACFLIGTPVPVSRERSCEDCHCHDPSPLAQPVREAQSVADFAGTRTSARRTTQQPDQQPALNRLAWQPAQRQGQQISEKGEPHVAARALEQPHHGEHHEHVAEMDLVAQAPPGTQPTQSEPGAPCSVISKPEITKNANTAS